MFDVTVAMDVEGSPAGVRNPTVLFGEMAPKQKIMKRARKRDVDVSPEVDMTDFRLTEAIFPRREPMRMHGNPGPGDNFLSESFGTKGHRETSAVQQLDDNSRCPIQAANQRGPA